MPKLLPSFKRRKPRSLSLNCAPIEGIVAKGKNIDELQSLRSATLARGTMFNFENGNILQKKTQSTEKELNGPGSPKVLLPIVVVFSDEKPGFQEPIHQEKNEERR